MDDTITCQGRIIQQSELYWLQGIIQDNPNWSRHKITKHICSKWGWRTTSGQPKTFAARSMIDKLEKRNLLTLPPVCVSMRRKQRSPFPQGFSVPSQEQIVCSLKELTPLSIHIPEPNSYEDNCVGYYLNRLHYLGFNKTVGENIKYLIRDRSGRDLACLLFGSAAWKTAARDSFIGWDSETRKVNINYITNNTRFLILPHVQIPHLASHVLGHVMRRIQKDWMNKYAHKIHMVETFVERDRFKGTCYKAANWLCIGQTKGRSRQDRYKKLTVPVKDIFLYPLTKNFKQVLCSKDKINENV